MADPELFESNFSIRKPERDLSFTKISETIDDRIATKTSRENGVTLRYLDFAMSQIVLILKLNTKAKR